VDIPGILIIAYLLQALVGKQKIEAVYEKAAKA